MAQFTVNAGRIDPYKGYNFILSWDNEAVAGVSKVSGLKSTVEVVEHREGGDTSTSRKMPGRISFEALTIERGVTHDKAFENWANKVWTYSTVTGEERSLQDFRKDLRLEVCNEAGQIALAYKIKRCWPSEVQFIGELDSNTSGVLIQSMKIEHEGFERDEDIIEPTEPQFGNAGAL